jgi:hypothetical protein
MIIKTVKGNVLDYPVIDSDNVNTWQPASIYTNGCVTKRDWCENVCEIFALSLQVTCLAALFLRAQKLNFYF